MLRILRQLELGPETFDEADRVARCRRCYLVTPPGDSRAPLPEGSACVLELATFIWYELADQPSESGCLYPGPHRYGRAISRVHAACVLQMPESDKCATPTPELKGCPAAVSSAGYQRLSRDLSLRNIDIP